MSNKVKYIIFSLLDYIFTYGGIGFVIVANYLAEDKSTGYKLTFTGIVLVVTLLFSAKAIFEKTYRQKYDTLLQQLAEATETSVKEEISKAIETHKTWQNIFYRATYILPFAILYVVTWFGQLWLSELNSTVGLILASMGAGSLFNIIKKPIGEKAQLDKIKAKAGK